MTITRVGSRKGLGLTLGVGLLLELTPVTALLIQVYFASTVRDDVRDPV